MTTLQDKMVFKDFKSAVDFAHKEWYSKWPRYMVEQYIFFADKHPNILDKMMTGARLSEEEEKIVNAGRKYKKTHYDDNQIIPDAVSVDVTGNATEEQIVETFGNLGEEKGENINLEDVPAPIQNSELKQILSENLKNEEDRQ